MLQSNDSKMSLFRRRSKELLVCGESERKGKHIKGFLHKKSSTIVLEKQCRHQRLVEEVCFEGHIITWTVIIPNRRLNLTKTRKTVFLNYLVSVEGNL